jgi:hypothetical protein
MTADDYAQLALAASPGVAVARVLTPANTGCEVPAGSIQIIILPYADASVPEPLPSRQLIADVTQYLQRRAPAGVAGGISVVPPSYYRVGVEVALVPSSADVAGLLSRSAKTYILLYLHPVIGGPEGRGWGFGETIYRSDLVNWLHDKLQPNLAYVQELRLLKAGAAVPEQLGIPTGQVPSAGPIRVIVVAAEEVCR